MVRPAQGLSPEQVTDIQTNLNAGAWAPGTAPSSHQLVVAYGRGRSTRIYTTAYCPEAGQAALRRCIAAHGPDAAARLVPGARSVT